MIQITGENIWQPEISIVETSDPVLGGLGGESNASAEGLADRTLFLKRNLIGAVMQFAMPSAPQGWEICDGSELDRVGDYADLFSLIGNRYGKSINFNILAPIDIFNVTAHGFTTGEIVNIENFGSAGLTIEFPGAVTITPATQCFVRNRGVDEISLHPTLSDANGDLNPAVVNPVELTDWVTISREDKFLLPNIENNLVIGSQVGGDADKVTGRKYSAVSQTSPTLSAIQLNFCIKYA